MMNDSWQSKLERLMVTLGNVGPAIDDELSHVYQRAEYDAIEIRMLREQLEIANLMLESRNRLVTRISHLETDLRNITARAEQAEAALRTALDSKEVFRICWEKAEVVVSAIPWRSLASIYAHPGVVLDADADAVGEFLDQYADEWAGGFAPSDNDSASGA